MIGLYLEMFIFHVAVGVRPFTWRLWLNFDYNAVSVCIGPLEVGVGLVDR